MAFIKQSGSRFQVCHGITGDVLSTFSTRAKAEEELASLHKKYMPKIVNRGMKAAERDRKRM